MTGLTGALVVSFLTPMFDTTALLLALLTIAWAADDAIEHAFDVPTPLDLIWKRHLKERIGR